MKLTFGWMGTLINKIFGFGMMIIHKPLLRRRDIYKKLLFNVLYWHISSQMKPAIMLQSMGNAIESSLMTRAWIRVDVDEDDVGFQQDGATRNNQFIGGNLW